MKIFPAIDLRGGKVVRLLKGDYDKMTVYGEDPAAVAAEFEEQGAEFLHAVDLDGAKDGDTPAFDTVREIVSRSGLKVEIGGGIRDEETICRYLDAGVFRVILGTAAVERPAFTAEMIRKYGEKIAVGVDLSGGMAAIRGWKEVSEVSADEIFTRLCTYGVSCVICTDIDKDGAMKGTNRALYRSLSARYSTNIVASGGVSTLNDVKALAETGIYGAIIGKALYTGDIDLRRAIEIGKEAEA
ncbi:MAG: 1-(5-phosphoribosyl)-5-[(5-phosphoribosylamino)methylideneamino]imidazole-4-carboxamide isomerase [Anaerovoracaceae bacterium]